MESHDYAIRLKAEIMVDHFHEQVMALNKIGGQARAMVVCSGIERAIQYFHAFREYLQERKSPYQAIVAFSGEHEFGGAKVTEASLNGFPSNDIVETDSGGPVSFPDLRRQVPDRLRRAAASYDVRGQTALRHQGCADALAPEPRAPPEARRVRPRFHEQHRDDSAGIFGLLPHDSPQRGDGPQQAPRPEEQLSMDTTFMRRNKWSVW